MCNADERLHDMTKLSWDGIYPVLGFWEMLEQLRVSGKSCWGQTHFSFCKISRDTTTNVTSKANYVCCLANFFTGEIVSILQ